MVPKSVLRMFCLISLFVSCYKVEPTTLEVTVKDNTGNVIPNAIVYAEGEPTISPSPSIEAIYESETNSNGVVQFELGNIYQPGQSGVAILKVIAEKNDKIGSGTIELIEEINNKLDIVVE